MGRLHKDGGRGDALAALFSSLPATEQGLHLLSEKAGRQRVQNRIQGAVDGKNEDYHPAGNGVLDKRRTRGMERKESSH